MFKTSSRSLYVIVPTLTFLLMIPGTLVFAEDGDEPQETGGDTPASERTVTQLETEKKGAKSFGKGALKSFWLDEFVKFAVFGSLSSLIGGTLTPLLMGAVHPPLDAAALREEVTKLLDEAAWKDDYIETRQKFDEKVNPSILTISSIEVREQFLQSLNASNQLNELYNSIINLMDITDGETAIKNGVKISKVYPYDNPKLLAGINIYIGLSLDLKMKAIANAITPNATAGLGSLQSNFTNLKNKLVTRRNMIDKWIYTNPAYNQTPYVGTGNHQIGNQIELTWTTVPAEKGAASPHKNYHWVRDASGLMYPRDDQFRRIDGGYWKSNRVIQQGSTLESYGVGQINKLIYNRIDEVNYSLWEMLGSRELHEELIDRLGSLAEMTFPQQRISYALSQNYPENQPQSPYFRTDAALATISATSDALTTIRTAPTPPDVRVGTIWGSNLLTFSGSPMRASTNSMTRFYVTFQTLNGFTTTTTTPFLGLFLSNPADAANIVLGSRKFDYGDINSGSEPVQIECGSVEFSGEIIPCINWNSRSAFRQLRIERVDVVTATVPQSSKIVRSAPFVPSASN